MGREVQRLGSDALSSGICSTVGQSEVVTDVLETEKIG